MERANLVLSFAVFLLSLSFAVLLLSMSCLAVLINVLMPLLLIQSNCFQLTVIHDHNLVWSWNGKIYV